MKKSRRWDISSITQEEFDQEELLKYLSLGWFFQAKMFANDSYQILETICRMSKEDFEKKFSGKYYYEIIWRAKILISSAQMKEDQSPIEMDQDYFFYIFDKLIKDDDPCYKTIKLIEKYSKISNYAIDQDLVDQILKMTKKNEQNSEKLNSVGLNIFYSLRPTISKFFKNAKPNSIKKSIDTLSLYYDVTPKELSNFFDFLEVKADEGNFLYRCIQKLFLFKNLEIFYQFQKHFSNFPIDYFQPRNFKLEPIIEWANKSLAWNQHFIDVYWKTKMKYKVSHFEEKDFCSDDFLDEFFPFFFAASFENLYRQKNYLEKAINFVKKKKYPRKNEAALKNVDYLISCVENDDKLISIVSNYLGTKNSKELLIEKSIPLIIKEISGSFSLYDKFFDELYSPTVSDKNSKETEKMRDSFFLIGKDDIENSETFIYAFKLYIVIINYVIGNYKDDIEYVKSQSKVEVTEDNYLQRYVSLFKPHFKDYTFFNKIFYDIHSLIFLKDQSGKYFCNTDKASKILDTMNSLFNIKDIEKCHISMDLIKKSRNHIIIAILRNEKNMSSKNNGFPLDDAFIPFDRFIFECIIGSKDDDVMNFNTAVTLAPTFGSDKMNCIIQVLSKYRNQKKAIKDQYKFCYAVEKFFSTNVKNDDDEDWFDNQELIGMQKYYSDYIQSLISKLDEIHQKYQSPMSLYLMNQNLILSTEFRLYLEIYKQFENSSANHKKGINGRLNPSDIIRILNESDIETNMENLKHILGNRSLEFILLHTLSFNNKTYNLVKDESEIAAQAIRYEFAKKGIYQLDKDKDKNNVYEKLLAKTAGCSDDEFEIISTDFDTVLDSNDATLNGRITDEEISDLMDKYLAKKPLPTKVLNDLYLRNPSVSTRKIKDLIQKDICRFSVSELLSLYPFCGMKSLPFLERMKIDKFDIRNIVNILIEKTRWTTIRLLMEDLRYLFDIHDRDEEEEEERVILSIITDCLIDHPEYISMVPKDFLINIDTSKFVNNAPAQEVQTSYVIESISDLNYLLMKGINTFDVNKTIAMINRLLQPIVIDNNSREMIQRQIHKLCLAFSKRFKHSFSTKLRALSSMLSRDLLGRYGIVISLDNFSSENFGSRMAKIHLKYDFFKECQEICAAWSLDFTLYKIERAIYAFRIGLIDEGAYLIVPPIRNDSLIDQIVDILSHKFIFDLSLTLEKEDPLLKADILFKMSMKNSYWVNTRVCAHTGKSLESDQSKEGLNIDPVMPLNEEPLVADSPQIKALHKILSDLNSYDKLIMFYSSIGNFEYAYDTWNAIKKRHTKSELFIRCIVFPSLISQNWGMMWMKIRKIYEQEQEKKIDNSDQAIKPYILDLFKFLHQRKMGYTTYNIQMALHLYQLAFKSAQEYFTEMKSWDGQLRIIDAMRKASRRDKETYKDVLAKLDFEENCIIKPCIKENVPFDREMNIMSTKKNALKAAVFLMKKGEVDTVMLKLLPLLIFTLKEMCHALLDDVLMQGEGAMHKLFVTIENANSQNYEVIIMNLFQTIESRLTDKSSLRKFIDENVRDDLKGQVFITFGFLDSAYDCAAKTHDKLLMELIKENAQKKEDKDLLQKATDYLNKS